MTKQENNELDLNSLYENRKKRNGSPSSLRRQVMKNALVNKPGAALVNRFQQLAIAAGTLLLISLVAIQYYDIKHGQPPMTYTIVEVHSMAAENNTSYAHISRQYDEHYRQFMQHKALLVSHHNKSAVLNQIEDGWELVTCDQELLKISNELIGTLAQMDLLGDALANGDNVNIAFNRHGLIVGIHQQIKPKKC